MNITIPISYFLKVLFREDPNVVVDPTIALIITQIAPSLVHLEVKGEVHTLWRYEAWRKETDYWIKQKERSAREREERFVQEENIKRVSLVLQKLAGIPVDHANVLAYRKVKTNNPELMKFLGVKLAKTTEDI